MSNIYEEEYLEDIKCLSCSEVMNYEKTLYKGIKRIDMNCESYNLFCDVYVCEYCGEETEVEYLKSLSL